MFNGSISRLATSALLWGIFFLICFGLGYPTLNRYDPGATSPDATEYAKMVRGEPNVAVHFRHRILVPYLAQPIFHMAAGHVGSWNPANFALLVVNSVFVSGTAFLLFLVVFRNLGMPHIALVSTAIYLLNFAVPNMLLAGLVDSGEAFFLMALTLSLFADWLFLLPFIVALGSLAKETFLPFSLVFAATWMLTSIVTANAKMRTERIRTEKKRSSGKCTLWLVLSGLAGVASLTAALSLTNGHLLFPWTYAGMLKSGVASATTAVAVLKDTNFWYVFVWLLPLGLFRLKRLPREWVMASFVTALLALGFTAYHNGIRDAGAAVARPIFSIAGPLLSVSVAWLMVELVGRQDYLKPARSSHIT
jgi:hypothetical protein